MFARGNWAIIGLTPETREAFVNGIKDIKKTLCVSQMAADLVTRTANRDSVGINPFSDPRLDEKFPLLQFRDDLVSFVLADEDTQASLELSDLLVYHQGYRSTPTAFAINSEFTRFGFWFVTNTYKDVSHAASIKEQAALDTFQRPVKFLNSTDKKVVDAAAQVSTAAIRKQFPVLLDFTTGRVYIESSSKSDIESVASTLKYLGAETYGLNWKFEVEGGWPTRALTQIFAETKYTKEFGDRAKEAMRFSPSEIEKLEDPEMQKIVTKYFASTNLGGDQWASLSAPAAITLYPGSTPIVVQTPTNATTLLGITKDAAVAACGVTIQERRSVMKKDGSERLFRKDIATFDITDSLNIGDVGAATLRGFDLPSFKSEIMREIRKSKRIPSIAELWNLWLVDMAHAVLTIEDELRQILGLQDDVPNTGIVRMTVGDGDDDFVIEDDGDLGVDLSSETPGGAD